MVDSLLSVFSNSSGIAQASWILGTKSGDQNNQLEVSANNGVNELILKQNKGKALQLNYMGRHVFFHL